MGKQFIKNILESGPLAMHIFTPEKAGGFCLGSAQACTHGGWTIYRGDGFKKTAILHVDSRSEAIKELEKLFGKFLEVGNESS